jgi:hypothetical protein
VLCQARDSHSESVVATVVISCQYMGFDSLNLQAIGTSKPN